MIRVKRGNCNMIGSNSTVLSELTVAIITGAEILSKQSNYIFTVGEKIVAVKTAIDEKGDKGYEDYKI